MTRNRPRSLRSALLALLLTGYGSAATAQPTLGPPIETWGPNGLVSALALDGHTLYVGGSFDQVGPTTGAFALVDPNDATAFTPTAYVRPLVNVATSDGAGGWFVATSEGFSFKPPRIAHILPSGAPEPAWVSPVFDNRITAMTVAGGRLFVAGSFVNVGGVRRPGIVALDATTGAVLPWDAELSDPRFPTFGPYVLAMAVSQGRVFLAGAFRQVHGVDRNQFAVLDAATAALLPARLPVALIDPAIQTITVTGQRVYLYGGCRDNGFVSCGYTLDLDPLPAWAFSSSRVPMLATDTAVYAVERISATRLRVEALDPDTGAAMPWSPVELGQPVTAGVQALAIAGGRLYVGGAFSNVNSQPRAHLAAVDATTGALDPWAPVVGNEVSTIVASAGVVAFGGRFNSVGGIRKRNLVAIDLRTGRPRSGAPDVAHSVYTMLKLGDVMVAGGQRTFGSTDPDLTAFSTLTGLPYPWSMSSNGSVGALATDGRVLYVGGNFSLLSGSLRLNLASVDLATATLTSWNPAPQAAITALAVSGQALYATGGFTVLPGLARNHAAAFDTASGAVLSFSPQLPSVVDMRGVAFYANRVLLAGTILRDTAANGVAWVDRVSGSPVPPTSDVPLMVGKVSQVGDAIYMTGAALSNQSQRLALVEGPTGRVRVWDSEIPFGLDGLAASNDYVVLGGLFDQAFGHGASNLVVLPAPRAGAPERITASVVNTTVTLGWQPGAEPAARSFAVEAGTSSGATDVGVFGVGTATQVTGTLPPGTYYTRVRGVATSGAGPASSEVIFSLPATATPPGTPGTLTSSVAGGVVTLAWSAAAGNATTYVLDVGTQSGNTNFGSLPLGHLDTTLTTPAPSGVYFVRVRAVNAHGSSAPSNEVQVVVP